MGPVPSADPIAHPKPPNHMAKKKGVDEGRKRLLAIVAGILVARHFEDDGRSRRFEAEPNDGVAGRIGRSMARADHEENRRRLSITNRSCQLCECFSVVSCYRVFIAA